MKSCPLITAVMLTLALAILPAGAQDVSAPVILQWFESSYSTIENRTADLFMAGYGNVWLPPPGRADSSDQSVGYDVYDRFDLGQPGRPTLYGTQRGLQTVGQVLDRAGVGLQIDLVLNHNGFSDLGSVDGGGNSFLDAGGYPGFLITHPSDIDGDFHSAFASGDLDGRLAGLIDIDHTKNFRYIRNPVPGFELPVPGDHGGNLPAGTAAAWGRLANLADENNRRFYPDRDGPAMILNDPATGGSNIAVYAFDPLNPLGGDPVGDNATGYLMRYAQWMVQVVGVDGFRIDAAKHFEPFVLDFIDQAVYRANPRTLLDGSTANVFSYSEVFDANRSILQGYVRKDIDPSTPTTVGGNRDVLDFALYFAMRDNLTTNGLQNDWANLVNAGMDMNDDALHNGSQGVMFVSSHDQFGPALSNVAHAFMLMQPGNSVVYFNGKEFGDSRGFPKDGRGDALGGVNGDAITTLVDIRNTHGRGDYIQRLLEKELYAYERQGSALVLLSNRTDGGFDQRTVDIALPWGTHLIELTGNAAANPDIPQVITVRDDFFEGPTKVDVRFLRNDGGDKGYLIYGLATPQSASGIELTNVDAVIAADPAAQNNYQNGVNRLTDLHVIKADSFQVTLQTQLVNLLGTYRDHDADGDNALIKIDGGMDLNQSGLVDFTTPGSVVYGFEQFTTASAGYFANSGAGGDGLYAQLIDTTSLSEGLHLVTVRAFRHRADGGVAVFSDFKKALYVDRLKPVSGIDSFDTITENVSENRSLVVQSLDQTANNIHVLFDLPAALSDAQVLSLIGASSQGNRLDRDLWSKDVFGLTHGNHVATFVSFEITGTFNVQRVAGLFTSTIFGAGLGDTDFNSGYSVNDIDVFENVLLSNNSIFNAAADMNGDGLVDQLDLTLLGDRLVQVSADAPTMAAYQDLVATIPEPASAALLLVGLLAMVLRAPGKALCR